MIHISQCYTYLSPSFGGNSILSPETGCNQLCHALLDVDLGSSNWIENMRERILDHLSCQNFTMTFVFYRTQP